MLKNNFRFDMETLLLKLKSGEIAFSKDTIIKMLSQSIFDTQYFTPNEIAKLMADLGKIYNPKSIIDITCGIGNILSYCDYSKKIMGVDINERAIEIAKILNPNIEFEVADSLIKKFNQTYDLVFSVFPFGVRIKRNGKTILSEVLFIHKALSILNPDGVFICIVPETFLFNKTYLFLRNEIINKHNLRLIINCPRSSLQYTSIRTSILLIENAPPTDKVFLTNYKNNSDKIINNYKNNKGELYIKAEKLKDRWDYSFHDPQFDEIEKALKGKEIKTIGEMADVSLGYSPKPEERLGDGEYRIIGGRNIQDGLLRNTTNDKFINYIDKPNFKRSILKLGDVIISLLFDSRKIYIYKDSDPKAVLNNSCAIIRSPNNQYILSYLKSEEGQKLFLKQADRATTGSVISRLSLEDLKKIKIPILPIENLEKVSNHAIEEYSRDELESLKSEIEYLRKELTKQKQINEQQEKFFENRIAKISEQISADDLLKRINDGESKKLEFKSTLRLNLHTNNFDKKMENEVLKTIVAFCNSEGGELLIGVDDNGKILGIELDRFPNEDKFLLHIGNLISQRIRPLVAHFIDFEIVEAENKKICKISCNKSNEDVWLNTSKGVDSWEFYIRTGPASSPLSPPDAVKYIKEHFK